MYQKNQNQTQVPNLNNASVQHPSTSQPGGMVPEARQALEDMKYWIGDCACLAGKSRLLTGWQKPRYRGVRTAIFPASAVRQNGPTGKQGV